MKLSPQQSKLLVEVEFAVKSVAPDEHEEAASRAIEAVADWFEEVIQSVGIQPSAIPALLRWQARQHEYLD